MEKSLRNITSVVLGIAGILLGISILYPTISGNVIAESAPIKQNAMGLAIIIVSAIALLISIKRKQQT